MTWNLLRTACICSVFMLLAVLAVTLRPQQSAAEKAFVESAAEDDQKDFPEGAGLKTDPELERILERATLFAKDGRTDLAAVLWQRVLDESGETLLTRDDWTYRTFDAQYRKYESIAQQIERTIASLPEEGRRIYRLNADGDAQVILAAGVGAGREAALGEVVRRYFMSSLGDDAAFELACMRLDRHDFVGASRLLTRLLSDYPDPTISRSDVLLRLALASARVGDSTSAAAALADFERTGGASRLLPLMKQEVAQGAASGGENSSGQWPMLLGAPDRRGHMPSLPTSITSSTLSESWVIDFEMPMGNSATSLSANARRRVFAGPVIIGGGISSRIINQPQQSQTPQTREAMVARWKGSGWLPAGKLLFANDLMYFKKQDRLVCQDLKTGEMRWLGRQHSYQGDPVSQWRMQMQRNYGMQNNLGGNRPATQEEMFLFADRLQQAMCIHNGLLFSVDGPLIDAPPPSAQNGQEGFNYNVAPRRARTTYLSAYDAHNGKFKWVRSADGSVDGSKFQVGFAGDPVPFARFLLVPVNDNGSLWLHAVEQASGELVWKTFLCEEPVGGLSAWSPVGVSVDGGDAYVATGSGVVVAVDAMSGATRWAVRYPRTAKTNENMQRFGFPYNQMAEVDGWEEDITIPYGKHLVVLASDSDKLFALDRRTGELLWDSPRKPAADDDAGTYCIGVLGDGLIVAGAKSLRRYQIPSGRLQWDVKVGQSFGHGVLTNDAIFLPVGDSIARFEPLSGRKQAEVAVVTPTMEPAGNLYSNGDQLLAVGMGRIYALQDLNQRKERLAQQIAEGDADAQIERMRLFIREKQPEKALEDLLAACELQTKQVGGATAARTLYMGLGELSLVEANAPQSLSLLVKAEEKVSGDKPLDASEEEQRVSQRDYLIQQALRVVREKALTGAADEIISALKVTSKPTIIEAARQAMLATAIDKDAELIKSSLSDGAYAVRMVAVAAVPKTFSNDMALGMLKERLADDDDRVKLTAALMLANQGERVSLESLGNLLESEELQVRARSIQALRSLTGQRIKFVAYDKSEGRAKGAAEWKKWLADNGATAELKFPLRDSQVVLGRTLVCYYANNRVVELDADNKQVWELTSIVQPWGCHGLDNGHRLICSYNGKFVVEYDEEGKEVWKKDNLPGFPSSVQRLEDGSTLVACSNANKIVEIGTDKKTVWEIDVEGVPQYAQRLDNGNTLVALQNNHKVVELDRSGKEVWKVENMNGPFSAKRLDNGNTLIAQSGGGQVVEVDQSGKTVWQVTGLSTPYDAQRLDNGNTLIVDTRGYREVDNEGKTVSETNANGVLRIQRY